MTKPLDVDLIAAQMSVYSQADRDFYAFWCGHMKNDVMQAPLGGIWHSQARYIWDSAIALAHGELAARERRQPLDQARIFELWGDRSDGPNSIELLSFARAIERAHGIGA